MPKFWHPVLAAFAGLLAAAPTHAQTAYTFGYNYSGQLGQGTFNTTPNPIPAVPLGLPSGVTAISGGADHTIAVANGLVYAWGYNGQGGLGVNPATLEYSNVPLQVAGLAGGAKAVFAGGGHSVAVLDNGTVSAWGRNASGQLGDGSTTQSFVPVQVQGITSGATAVAGGYNFTLAIQNGAVKAWGAGGQGQLGNNTSVGSNLPVQVSGLTSGVTAIAAGSTSAIAIQNGSAKVWGSNGQGEYGNGTTTSSLVPVQVSGLTSGVTSVAMGHSHVLAIMNGNVYSWGANETGQLGIGVAGGPNQLTPALVTAPGGLPSNFTKVAAGGAFSDNTAYGRSGQSFALTADGRLFAWGLNLDGELGLGYAGSHVVVPTEVFAPSGFRFSGIDGGDYHTIATLVPVPEPGSTLAVATLAGLMGFRLRRRTK